MQPLTAERFVIGGDTFELTTAPSIPAATIAAAAQRLGWSLPDDYAQFLTTHGAADVFGAKLLEPAEWRARCEHLDDDPAGMMANFLPFAQKPIAAGGMMLFCFRFEMSLPDLAKKKVHGPFHGASYSVVGCHLPHGLAGARLEPVHRVVAPTFSAWIDQIVHMLRARSGAV